MDEFNQAERQALAQAVLDAESPMDALLRQLEALDARQELHLQAALYESLLWRTDLRHYWICFRMARVYADLSRPDAAFAAAAQALQIYPDWPASGTLYRELFRRFSAQGQTGAAAELFLAHARHMPEHLLVDAHEAAPVLAAAGVVVAAPPADPAPDLRHDHRVFEAQDRPPTPVPWFGRFLPPTLQWVGGKLRRHAIDVAEFPGGELLICNDAAVVCRADGAIETDFSVCPFPELVRRKLDDAGDAVETRAVPEAVLLLDSFPPPNLGHFLLDQVSRLELYWRAGADLSRATVVTAPIVTAYQREILERARISRVLDTSRMLRLRAERLWVSSNCRALQHPAHLGSDWAIGYVRELLGGRGHSGARKLYLSRGDAPGRRVANEAALIELLAADGFEAITPGAMPYAEQLAAFRDASHVVATHGAALTHVVLCPPGARVLELFHPLYATWTYAVLAHDCGLAHSAAVGLDALSDAPELNDLAHFDSQAARFGNRDFRADLDAVRAWLAQAV